ncbi:PorP/SprF family type IX secretion system membrane protein [Rufibacter roseus]|uniref:PorP/SprF family type IX secretion system membrane protein n=1 Tax=Rufibacter roseus TaxID=1567108 RepID=A0ABW2DIN9_9BACT|nr:PorP/SprF family type IX secretion system membrane protein [Rufibacter roseus]
MKLKRILAFGLVMLGASLAEAQTVPKRTMVPRLYHQNYFYLNPAYAGAEGKRVLGLTTHLNSIGGKSSSAPLSVIATYQGQVGDTTRNGVGVLMMYDQFDAFWLGKFGLTYSKRFILGEQSSIAIGAQLAAEYLNVDLYELPAGPDGRRMVGHDNDLRPDIDLGVWLNHRDFYAGASFTSLLKPTFNLSQTAEREDVREMFLTAGYKFNLADQVSITPSFLVDRALYSGAETNIQAGALANYKVLVGGLFYRGQFDKSAPVVVNAGVNLNDKFQFMTSFDITKEANGVAKPDPQVEASLRYKF